MVEVHVRCKGMWGCSVMEVETKALEDPAIDTLNTSMKTEPRGRVRWGSLALPGNRPRDEDVYAGVYER